MKFTIHRLQFLKNLTDVQRAISNRTTIPILTGVKLQVTQEGILLTGSDTELTIESLIPISDEVFQLSIDKEGSVVLPARFFSEILKKLPADMVTIEVNEAHQTTITAGQSLFTISGLDAEEYPLFPVVETENTLNLPVELFRQVLQQTLIAVSSQESRPILTGVAFTIKDGYLKAVATDSHRLSQRIIPLQMNDTVHYECVIAGKTLQELAKIMEGFDQIELAIADNQVIFQAENITVYSRLLEGRYPDVSRLITNDATTTLTVNASDLLHATDRASLVASTNNNVIKLKITDGKVMIIGDTPEIGLVEEELTVEQVEGEALTIAFNPNYLKDSLKSFGSTDVVLRFISAARPFTLVPKEELSDVPFSFIQLITPVRTAD